MPKYSVYLAASGRLVAQVEIEADDPEAARDTAKEMSADGSVEYDWSGVVFDDVEVEEVEEIPEEDEDVDSTGG